MTLVLALGALRTRGLGRNVKVLASVVFAGTLAQAPLGAVTVYFHLNPYLVISHLLVSLVVLGLTVLVLLEATRLLRGGAEPAPRIARIGGVALLVTVGLLVVSGTLATAAGPHPGSSGTTSVRRIGSFDPAVYWHVRAVAAFGLVFLALALWAWRNRERFPWLVRGCAGLLAILLAQMTIGEVQFRTNLPWWLVLVHVSVAAGLFGWTVGLAARLWRPLAAEGRASRLPRV